jgi:hypothetical protein
MPAAGVDIKIVSETLGHSATRITRDIYQSVLDDLARDAAEKVVQLAPHARKAPAAVPDVVPQADLASRLPRMVPPRKNDASQQIRSP